MKHSYTILIQALLWLAASSHVMAQTVTRTFYIDFGQNNVTGQGFVTGDDSRGTPSPVRRQ